MSQSRYWIFTLNNPDSNFSLNLTEDLTYYVYQKEKGEQDTEHIQGYIALRTKRRLQFVKNIVPRAHWEVRRGTHTQARDYCRKEDTRIGETCEEGIPPPTSRGERTDLKRAVQMIIENKSTKDILDEIGDSYIRCKRSVNEVAQQIIKEEKIEGLRMEYSNCHLRPWQSELMGVLEQTPHPRELLWYVDLIGNSGKTWMSKYLVSTKSAVRFENGKSADIKYGYSGERIVVFDYSRSVEDRVNYEVLECIKNGIFYNTKYESSQKIFDTPHVVVFSNFQPERRRLSLDRWNVTNINQLT